MRTIKFRSWREDEKIMRYGVDISEVVNTDNGECYNSHTKNLMQFTGIHDKNGKEIYEGDILFGDIMPHKHSVEYIGSGFKVFGRDLNWKPDHNSKPLNEILEIIGNIYENPELIK